MAKIPIPDTDFDFESSNAKFDKSELREQGDADAGDDDSDDPSKENSFYEKTSSFFDNISCEAKDRAESGGHEYVPGSPNFLSVAVEIGNTRNGD